MLAGYLFLLPAVVLIGLFLAEPFVKAIQYSLQNWDGVGVARYVGLFNYQQIFALERFRWALLNSTIVASSATAISLVIGSLCAYAIARLNFPFKNLLLAMVMASQPLL